MSMMEYFEAGYEVVCGSMWGDVKMEDADMVECYMEDGDMELQYVDEDAKSVYYYEVDYGQYDDQVARPFFMGTSAAVSARAPAVSPSLL